MMPEKSVKREQFNQAKQQWNLERLYNNLASIKGKMLTPMERLHLRGLLCGYSPTEIAERLHKEVRGVETDLSATIYQYVKGLVNKKIENWRNIPEYLGQEGYKTQPAFPLRKQRGISLPIEALEGLVTINHSFRHNRKIAIEINISLVASLPEDEGETTTDISDNNPRSEDPLTK